MQALSSYEPEQHAIVQPALQALEENLRLEGLTAGSYSTPRGLFARFVWPDWPESVAKEVASKVESFHKSCPGLRRIEKASSDWTAVFRWKSDPASAEAIGERFRKHFNQRVLWVESERDQRGRIGAGCMVKGIGKISLHLFWRDSLAGPVAALGDADRSAFQLSVNEVFQWAEQRIRAVLEGLHEKLQNLYGDRFRGLYVFGSYARPDAGIELPEDSDLDVALLLSDFESAYQEIDRFGQINADLSLDHGLVVSIVPVREADFREGRTNFTRVISEYAIPVK